MLSPSVIRDVSIVSIPVSDPGRAKRFYTGALGIEVVRDEPMGRERRWVELRPPRAATSIVLVTWFAEMPPGGVQGLVLETADVDADFRGLVENGVEAPVPKDAPWGRFTTFDDPDGNGWVLQQRA